MKCNFVLSAKPKSKGRKSLTRDRSRKRNKTDDKNHSRLAKEPLLLATSLKCSSRLVVEYYGYRMQIEESFRDIKSHRYGFSFEDVGCNSIKRIEVLLLIASFANVAMHIVGIAAEKEILHYQFQANTIRNRRVLSLFSLAKRIFAMGLEPPNNTMIKSISNLRHFFRTAKL